MNHTTYLTTVPSLAYGYTPDQGVNALFLAIFASGLIGCGLLTLCTRRWVAFSAPLILACLLEVVGYAVRAGSTAKLWDLQMYTVTTVVLTLAPSLVSIGIYETMRKTFSVLGNEHSLLHPKCYVHLIHVEYVGLVIQLIGFGVSIASITKTARLGGAADTGGYIVAAGLGVHVLALLFCLVVFATGLIRAVFTYCEFGRATLDPERGYVVLSRRFIFFLAALAISLACLSTRGLYRIVGFAGGFDGGSRNEGLFALFDGLMVSQTVLGLVVFHPALVFSDDNNTKLGCSTRATPEIRHRGEGVRHEIV